MSLESNIKAVKEYLDKCGWKYEVHGERGEMFKAYFKMAHDPIGGINHIEIITRVKEESVILTARSCYTVSNLEEKCEVMGHITDLHDDDAVDMEYRLAQHKKKKELVRKCTDTDLVDYIARLVDNRVMTLWTEEFKLGCFMTMSVTDWSKVGPQLDERLFHFYHRVIDLRESITKELWRYRREKGIAIETMDMWPEERDVEQDANEFMERMSRLVSSAMK